MNNDQITTEISLVLSNLIAEANSTIETAKEKILAAYNYAIEKEGYTPQEAAKILRERLTFSKRYIREVLPLEAKDETKRHLYLNHDEERDPHPAPADSELEKFRQEKGTPTTTFSSSVYPQFQFRTMLPMKDQDVPVIVTVYPDKQTEYLEVDEKLARELKRF